MTRKRKAPTEIDEKALDGARAGSDKGYVVTQVQHAATQAVRHKLFSIVDRTQL